MYEILSIQDVSRPRCKRYVAHIKVDAENKNEIKSAILEATEEIRNMKKPCHVVRLYVHVPNRPTCQSMWVDKTVDAPLPIPLNYNDSIYDVGIVW